VTLIRTNLPKEDEKLLTFYLSKDNTQQSKCCTTKLLTSFLLSYGLLTKSNMKPIDNTRLGKLHSSKICQLLLLGCHKSQYSWQSYCLTCRCYVYMYLCLAATAKN